MISRHVVVVMYQPLVAGNPPSPAHGLSSAVRHCFLGFFAGPLRSRTGTSNLSP